MEWKIGEIRQINGEWYQAVKGIGCNNCDLRYYDYGQYCMFKDIVALRGCCSKLTREDKQAVIFKKLEKVGEPYRFGELLMQQYRIFTEAYIPKWFDPVCVLCRHGKVISIEIKQNKEDMEEKKLSLKPFDIQKAREGKPVCTRDGRSVRIICFDAKCNLPIIALITDAGGDESLARYNSNGRFTNLNESDCDLMMLPEKKEGWVNVYKKSIYKTKEDAFNRRDKENYLMTIKVGWEE